MRFSTNIYNQVRDYIDKYRVVNFCNLHIHFYQISKSDLVEICMGLYRRNQIRYYQPKPRNPEKTLYFSVVFNPTSSRSVFENNVDAITKCLTALETFKNNFKKSFRVVYDELSFYPTVIKFGVVSKTTHEESNIQLVYLPYSENNDLAEYIGRFYDQGYDDKYNIVRYVVVEVPGMLRGNSPQKIADSIPRVKGFVLCTKNGMSADFYAPEDLGVVINE